MSLLTITAKHLTGFEVPDLQVHCEIDCIAEQLIELQVDRCGASDSLLSGCPINGTKSL